MDHRKKLFCSLMIQEEILLNLLPKGNPVNKAFTGWELSFSILIALLRHLPSPSFSIHGKYTPLIIFCAVVITPCKAFYVMYCAHPLPQRDRVSQHTVNGNIIEAEEDLLKKICPPQLPHEI